LGSFGYSGLYNDVKLQISDGRHFEIGRAPYLNEKLSDFDEVWCAEANSNFSKFKTADVRHFKNSVLAITQHRIILFWLILCKDENKIPILVT